MYRNLKAKLAKRDESVESTEGKNLSPLKTLEYFARVSPESVALINEKRTLTFAQLNSLVRQFAIKFRDLGIEPGDFVVTKLPVTLDWISTLALMSLGAITCSKAGRAEIDSTFDVRFLISDGSLVWKNTETIIMNDSWLHEAEQVDPNHLVEPQLDRDSSARVVFTNGTLSNPKAVALSLSAINERINHNKRSWLNEKSVMTLMDLSSALGFLTFYSLLSRGEKIVTTSQFNLDVVRMAISQEIEVFVASTLRVLQLMELLKRTESMLPKLRKIVISGNVPTLAVLQQVKKTLGVEVQNVYSSIECGNVSLLSVNSKVEAGDMGWIYPDTQVKIVNAKSETLVQGMQGRIATRTSSMVFEYFRTAQPNRNVFEDGWFFSGDIGYVTEDGRLMITGRESELISVGKLRVNSQSIEELVLDYAGVVDCAAFGLTSRSEEPALGVAIAGDKDLNLKLMSEALARELGEMAPTRYFVTDSIPRDLNGRVQKALLLEALNKKIAKRDKGQGESQ
jgi:acyl-coenzyme A synthetase/AMP-(fatty) acid ligase